MNARRPKNGRLGALIAGVLLVTGACSTNDTPEDPRLGELGKLRFTSGCNSSTTMALGSRATVKMEPVSGELPSDLRVDSSAPGIIAAELAGPDAIELAAEALGEARIAVDRGGNLFDAITFDVEVATAAKYDTVPRVFIGGAVDVVVTEIYGACGTDECPLFGHSFLDWRVEPSEALPFDRDAYGTARFTAATLDAVNVFGREPSTGRDLVAASLEIVSTEGIDGLRGTLQTIPLEEGEEARSFELGSGVVREGEAFCVRLDALRGSDAAVGVSRHDVTWVVEGDALESIDTDHGTEPLGTVFNTVDHGTVTLTASSHLFEHTASWELVVQPRP